MKKLIALAFAFVCAASLCAYAGEGKKGPQLNDEQKALKAKMTEKYDANKDGKLDKDEMAKMTDEEKAEWKKVMPAMGGHKKKAE